MGPRELALTLAATWALVLGFLPPARAFHDGGVGACDGCHQLHPEQEIPEGGRGTDAMPSAGLLLRGGDAASTCLRCHAEQGKPHTVLSEDGSSFHAGGDFYWLTRSYAWIEDGQSRFSTGDSHGHSVVATEFGLHPDNRFGVAPGGDYPASELSCISCHDPHGQRTSRGSEDILISGSDSSGGTAPSGSPAGTYRLLGGSGYGTAGTVFSNDAPVALAPRDWRETDRNHVDYGSGMSAWCANCHFAMLEDSSVQHPAGASGVFTERTASAYGAYLRTGDLAGSPDSSYVALVPFERGVADPGLLDASSSSGPIAGVSNVMCLTCHRAHASAFPSIFRWDPSATFLTDSHPGPGDVGAGGSDLQNSYYGRDLLAQFGPYQRSLCNKCHVQD